MSKPRRNDPCSCGSGKKYKKCCLDEEATALDERRRLHHENQAQSEAERAELAARYRDRTAAPMPLWIFEQTPLDDISNSVLDLIRDKNFEQALRVCEVLLADYPDVIDGLERSGLVYSAMGEHEKAAGYYQRCLDFIDEHPLGFDRAAVEDYEEQLAKVKRLAQAR